MFSSLLLDSDSENEEISWNKVEIEALKKREQQKHHQSLKSYLQTDHPEEYLPPPAPITPISRQTDSPECLKRSLEFQSSYRFDNNDNAWNVERELPSHSIFVVGEHCLEALSQTILVKEKPVDLESIREEYEEKIRKAGEEAKEKLAEAHQLVESYKTENQEKNDAHEERLKEALAKNEALLTRIQAVDAKVLLLQEQLLGKEQERMALEKQYAVASAQLEDQRNQFQEQTKLVERLTIQVNDATAEAERYRREALKATTEPNTTKAMISPAKSVPTTTDSSIPTAFPSTSSTDSADIRAYLAKISQDLATQAKDHAIQMESLRRENDRLRAQATTSKVESTPIGLSGKPTLPPSETFRESYAQTPPPKKTKAIMANSASKKIDTLSTPDSRIAAGVCRTDKENSVGGLLSFDSPPVKARSRAQDRVKKSSLASPFATETTVHRLEDQERKELEKNLLQLHIERERLTAEFTKLEEQGARTIMSRNRKKQIEARLENLNPEITRYKHRLKQGRVG